MSCTTEWQIAETLDVDFSIGHFWDVMGHWLQDPEIVTRTILRGEILTNEVISPEGQRVIHRKLLPRSPKKDTPIEEKILWISSSSESRVEHWPIVDWMSSTHLRDSLKLPFFYPKVLAFAYVYTQPTTANQNPTIAIQVIPLPQEPEILSSPTLIWTLRTLLQKLEKHGKGRKTGYKKRVHHDQLVPKVVFQDTYLRLKNKYAFWVHHWPEATDPQKYVFEDIGIASFLIALWEQEMNKAGTKRKPSFVDLGCGNGFLTHILTEEGYSGYGIDLSKRKLWSQFQGTDLRTETIFPEKLAYPDANWIIGNHPDELTLWIPIIAARSGYSTKFIIIPCCFYGLSGAKVSYSTEVGRYESFMQMTEEMARDCGYEPEREALRIPSTKNKAIIGRKRTISPEDTDFDTHLDNLISDICFTPRKSDHEKGRIRMAKAKAREELIKNPRSLDEFEMSLFSELAVFGGSVLSFTAGFINVITMAGVYSATVSHVTGNITRIAIAIWQEDLTIFALVSSIVGSFMFGSFVAGFLVGDSRFKLGRTYGYVLLLESGALFLSFIFTKNELVIGEWLAAFACGLQNAMATSYSGFAVRTTHMTGIVTDIGSLLGQACRSDTTNSELWRLKVFVPLLVGYILGALGGQVAYLFMRDDAILLPCIFVGAIGSTYLLLPAVKEAKEILKSGIQTFIPSEGDHVMNPFTKLKKLGSGILWSKDKDQIEIIPQEYGAISSKMEEMKEAISLDRPTSTSVFDSGSPTKKGPYESLDAAEPVDLVVAFEFKDEEVEQRSISNVSPRDSTVSMNANHSKYDL